MRIAMLGQKSIPFGSGGVEVVVEELATAMAAQGHQVTCYNRRESGRVKLREYQGVRLKTVPTIQKRGLAAASGSFFATLCSAFGRYDVVHIHAEGPAFLCWLPKLLGKRVIVTVHGLDHQRAKWGNFARRYILCGERKAARYAHEVIVLSRNVQEYFQKVYGRETVYLPNGIAMPTKREAEQITRRWGLKKDEYLLFLGRLVPEKGVKYLIEAYLNIETDKKLVISGGSSDTDHYVAELKALVGDDERIIFTDFVRGQLKEELLSNAWVYVLPSDLEGMPLSLLEALSYGNCCLTSDISECTEVVKEKAPLFRRGDVSDLTEKLQMLCDEPEQVAQYRAWSGETLDERYDWSYVAEKTLKIYEKAKR